MAGAGTNDEDLIRVVVTRAEKDMVQIKQAYIDAFGKTLGKAIKVSWAVNIIMID